LYLATSTAGDFLRSDFDEELIKELTPLINSLLIKINREAIIASTGVTQLNLINVAG